MLKREEIVAFPEIGRLPAPDDNVAIATRRVEAGTAVRYEDTVHVMAHTVLEGHRFTVRPIAPGEALRSWGFPFGRATTSIPAFGYICNDATRQD
jgi:hypothetical protein